MEQGTLKLDSETTEQLIGKFGVAETGDLTLKLTTSKSGWERGKHQLHILLFTDDTYRQWNKEIKKGSLCRDRNKLADIEKSVDLPHELATHHGGGWEYFVDPESGKSYRVHQDSGESEWNSPHNSTRLREEGPANRITHRESTFKTELAHHYPLGRGRNPRGIKHAKSSHWYVVVSDCALEFYDARPPPMHYDLTIFDGGSHLPNDLAGMGKLYWLLLIVMLLCALPGASLAQSQYRRLGRVHVLVVLVAASYAFQTASLALELAHLARFSVDGKGLQWRYTVFAADFLAEVSQGAAEFLTTMLLLFLACGWTTVSAAGIGARLLGSLESGGSAGSDASPTESKASVARKLAKDVPTGVVAMVKGALKLDEDDPETKRRVQRVASALRAPAGLVLGLGNRLKLATGGDVHLPAPRTNVGSVLVFALMCAQMSLEIASRSYVDDFNGFHDHEHWPGYGLVFLRLVCLVIFLAGGRAALGAAERNDPDAARFLRDLRKIGGAWLAAFPFLVATAWCAPPLARHRYVAGGCATLQSVGLIGLGFLCLASERFLAVSSVAPRDANAAGNVAGTRGFASKLAVD